MSKMPYETDHLQRYCFALAMCEGDQTAFLACKDWFMEQGVTEEFADIYIDKFRVASRMNLCGWAEDYKWMIRDASRQS